MGAWSEEPFGNDDACDWLEELNEASNWSLVEEALEDGLMDGKLYGDVALNAVGAAEVVAHGLGRPTQEDGYTESIAPFVKRAGAPAPKLVKLAQKALRKSTGKRSALAELWGNDESWRKAIRELALALKKKTEAV